MSTKSTKKSLGFNLDKNNLSDKCEQGHEFEVLMPETKEGTNAFITVRGVMSPAVKKFQRKKFAEFQNKAQVAKRKGREDEPMSLDEAEDLAVETALVRIISWKGFTSGDDDKELEFNEVNARKLLTEHSWIREQVLEESDTLANFI